MKIKVQVIESRKKIIEVEAPDFNSAVLKIWKDRTEGKLFTPDDPVDFSIKKHK